MENQTAKGTYNCPMHPEVLREGPGTCAQCGMALVLKGTAIEPNPGELDPVCGMKVDSKTAKNFFEFKGKIFYFCGKGCQEKFKSEPGKYLKPATQQAIGEKSTPPSKGNLYTCPMHPEIRQDHPGDCPKCGMHLEPATPTQAGPEENIEMKKMTRRLDRKS